MVYKSGPNLFIENINWNWNKLINKKTQVELKFNVVKPSGTKGSASAPAGKKKKNLNKDREHCEKASRRRRYLWKVSLTVRVS